MTARADERIECWEQHEGHCHHPGLHPLHPPSHVCTESGGSTRPQLVLLKLEAGAHVPNPVHGSYSPPAAWAYWHTVGGASSGRRSANSLDTAPEILHYVQGQGSCRGLLLGKRGGQLAWLALLDQGSSWCTEGLGACA